MLLSHGVLENLPRLVSHCNNIFNAIIYHKALKPHQSFSSFIPDPQACACVSGVVWPCVLTLRAGGTARRWFVSSTQSTGTLPWSATSTTWAAATLRWDPAFISCPLMLCLLLKCLLVWRKTRGYLMTRCWRLEGKVGASSVWIETFLNLVFLLSPQVYKATGEEFLKIAGGQISGFFFPLLSSLRVCMKTFGERLSVNVQQTSISWLSRIFEEKQESSTSVKEQLFSDR